jgi:hypothetical protein
MLIIKIYSNKVSKSILEYPQEEIDLKEYEKFKDKKIKEETKLYLGEIKDNSLDAKDYARNVISKFGRNNLKYSIFDDIKTKKERYLRKQLNEFFSKDNIREIIKEYNN